MAAAVTAVSTWSREWASGLAWLKDGMPPQRHEVVAARHACAARDRVEKGCRIAA